MSAVNTGMPALLADWIAEPTERESQGHKMIAALERLKLNQEQAALPKAVAAFGISGGGGLSRLFMTHPPLEERIEALRRAA